VPPDEATDPDLDAATDERISSIIVTIDWQKRDIEDALHDLEIQCHRADPDKPLIRFQLDRGPGGAYQDPKHPTRRSITYNFDKFSVRRLLAYIAMITNTGFAIHRDEIIFVPTASNSPEIASKIRSKFPTLFIGPRADQEE